MKYFLSLFALALVISCGHTPESAKDSVASAPSFSLPEIPLALSGLDEREAYLAAHFWDLYDFRDSLLLWNDSVSGMAVAGYISVLDRVDSLAVRGSVDSMVEKVAAAPSAYFHKFMQNVENYLYNPNSPMRNETYFLWVVSSVVANPQIDTLDKSRSLFQKEMLLKNNVGDRALDFVYTLDDGSQHSMHTLAARYTILFFNSPDCHDCMRVKEIMMDSRAVLDSAGVVTLAVYPESDLDLWREASYPDFMIDGYDKGQRISKERLYDLKAIPTLYLLDAHKRVVLKDVPFEAILDFLQN